MKTKWIKMLVAAVILVVFGLFAVGSGESTENNQGSGSVDIQTETAGELGDYNVEIKSCRLAKDYEGKNVVIVKYGFTNNSDSSASFDFTFEDQVFQAGIGLNKAYVLADNANYSEDNKTKEIKTGATLDVEVAYELNDNTTDIEVEVKELFSFSDSVVKKNFSIIQ